MSKEIKILIIGLDGATFDLLDPWMENGELPFLAKFQKEAAKGYLKTTIPVLTGAALPSFYTGQNPARTGVFHFVKPDGSLYSFKDIKAKTIWDHLNDHGKRCLIVNLPTTYPPKPMDGTIVAGAPPYASSPYLYPKDSPMKGFHDKINHKIQNHDRKKNLKIISEDIYRQAGMFIEECKMGEYDFAIYWITRTDQFQHFFWDDKELLLAFWKRVDKALEKIISETNFTHVTFVSDHGFESVPKLNFNMNMWLNKEGFLKVKAGLLGKAFYGTVIPPAVKLIPLRYLEKIKRSLFKNQKQEGAKRERVLDTHKGVFPGIDYKKSEAFLTQAWGISLNNQLKKEEKERLKKNIMDRLSKAKDAHGKHYIREIYSKEEVFVGPYLDQMPDIVFLNTEDYISRPTVSFGLTSPPTYKRKYKGAHYNARKGIFLAAGPGLSTTSKKGLSIMDVTPTVLHMYGLPVTPNIDGKVMKNLFETQGPFDRRVTVKVADEEFEGKLKNISKGLKGII